MERPGGDLLSLFFERYAEEVDRMPNANILIVGKTGVGKSTLINSVFREDLARTGIGNPVTRHIQRISKDGLPLTIYDTQGLELSHSVQETVKQELLGLIRAQASSGDRDAYIHLVWYCVNSLSNRIESYELDWIRELSAQLPVIVVLTQSVGMGFEELRQHIIGQQTPARAVIAVLARPYPIRPDLILPAFGLQELVDATLSFMPEAVQRSFINAQKVDTQRKLRLANRAVIGYVSGAFAAGFTPIPFADAALLVPAQIAMIAHLTALFGLPVERSLMAAMLTAVGGSGGATMLGRTIVAQLAKLIPGLGTVTGGMINGTTAALLTASLGFAYNQVMSQVARRMYAREQVSQQEMIDLMRDAYQVELSRNRARFLGKSWRSEELADEHDDPIDSPAPPSDPRLYP